MKHFHCFGWIIWWEKSIQKYFDRKKKGIQIFQSLVWCFGSWSKYKAKMHDTIFFKHLSGAGVHFLWFNWKMFIFPQKVKVYKY